MSLTVLYMSSTVLYIYSTILYIYSTVIFTYHPFFQELYSPNVTLRLSLCYQIVNKKIQFEKEMPRTSA